MASTATTEANIKVFALSNPEHDRSLSVLILEEEPQSEDTTALSKTELDMLGHCESIIEENLNAFFQVGEALGRIKKAKLYRKTHKTFEAYCLDKWKFGRQRAYQFIQAQHTASEMSESGVQISDLSERQLRVLKPFDANERAEILDKATTLAAAAGKRRKTSHIQEAIRDVIGTDQTTVEPPRVEIVTDPTPFVDMPAVTEAMLTDGINQITEDLEHPDCPQGIRNSVGTFIRMVRAYIHQNTAMELEVAYDAQR